MTNDERLSVTTQLVVAERYQIRDAVIRNTPSMLWVAGACVAYLLTSTIAFPRVESLSWPFSKALYFTALSVFAGSNAFGYDPMTSLGGFIVILNVLIGLILFGIFIAIVTMSFQPTEVTATATSGAGGAGGPLTVGPLVIGLPASAQASGAQVERSVNAAIEKADQILKEKEVAKEKDLGLAEVRTKLQESSSALRQARMQFEAAEGALMVAEGEASAQLNRAPYYMGLDADLVVPRPAIVIRRVRE